MSIFAVWSRVVRSGDVSAPTCARSQDKVINNDCLKYDGVKNKTVPMVCNLPWSLSDSDVALVKNNARVGSAIAVHLATEMKQHSVSLKRERISSSSKLTTAAANDEATCAHAKANAGIVCIQALLISGWIFSWKISCTAAEFCSRNAVVRLVFKLSSLEARARDNTRSAEGKGKQV